jgi:glycosyltransferase involved in cell wall biosynthesis
MKWYYDALDLIYVNSDGYRTAWIERGIAAEKMAILPRGLDTTLFHPSRRDPEFWVKRGAPRGAVVLLYVGRISKEKDLEVIVEASQRGWGEGRGSKVEGTRAFDLQPSTFDPVLAFVGDGPFLAELRTLLPGAIFTGYLAGAELARAYASADLFIFPSTTDTFGNVILEAQASGLPCVVSDQGGPKDLVEHGVSGFVTRALDADDFASHVAQLVRDSNLRKRMSEAGLASIGDRDWAEAGRRFWNGVPATGRPR